MINVVLLLKSLLFSKYIIGFQYIMRFVEVPVILSQHVLCGFRPWNP